MRLLLLLSLLLVAFLGNAQKVTLQPSIAPALFQHNSDITVTYDVTGTSLSSLTQAWIWVWIPNVNINAKYNINPTTSAADPAKFTKSVVNGRTLFTITFKPSDFFTQDISAQTSMGMLLKAADWAGGQTTDYVANFGFTITLTSPTKQPVFVDAGGHLMIAATAPAAADFQLYVNDVLVDSKTATTSYSYLHAVAEVTGTAVVRLTATSGSNTAEKTFSYSISESSPLSSRPDGIIPGVNYHAGDPTRATLCLWAPGKTTVHLSGEFNDWDYELMNRDGDFFWLELTNLTAGTEYAFHYLVEESAWVADPYADKILDPDDQYISSTVYAGLKQFPEEALSSEWYFNRLSVLQTAQTPYAWQVTNFVKPPKEELVVYELLIRDFFEDGNNTYQSLTDTVSYLKNLGINAIELMPIMEFGGNNSWGYNPQFMFAPDKAYGPKNKLKEFIDVCHQNGIAVILDIAMNHQDLPNPYLMMDFDFQTFKPTVNNKWFNVSATHPFNVFFDMNHESSYTKAYLDTVNNYWLSEYKIDGYRFDLSKGFTQVSNPADVSAWSAYDASRIAILKRMADEIWNDFPDAYVILEHLSVNSEEKELAEYRAAEGKGMMLWGNMNHAYAQNSMGFASGSDISGTYHASRSWTVPHLVSYMESHDEERMMFRNTNSGNSSGDYNVRQLATGLERTKAAASVFYLIPGPKMLWQFGELGYDYSINRCEDNTIKDECRTYPKPVAWEYTENEDRAELLSHVSDLLRLRNTYSVFRQGTAAISGGNTLKKQLIVKNEPYTEAPQDASEMNAVVAVNFELTQQSLTITFPHQGKWYEYYSGQEYSVSAASQDISFAPGQYRLFTDVRISDKVITGIEENAASSIQLFPNPAENHIQIDYRGLIRSVSAYSMQGSKKVLSRISATTWDVSALPSGLYVLAMETESGVMKTKILKK